MIARRFLSHERAPRSLAPALPPALPLASPPSLALSLSLFWLAAASAFGCRSTACGIGTEDVGGICVPTLACGPGTVEDAGACHPVVTCGENTYQMDGVCVPLPPEGIEVDVLETAEPNDPFAGGALSTFVLPAVGEPAVLVGGNVAAPESSPPSGDVDGFLFQGTAGTLVRLTGVSRGAAAVAFVVQGWELGVTGYVRFGYHGAGDSACRDVILPADGEYALLVSEAAIVAGLRTGVAPPLPPGGPGDGYAVAVETLALPAPTDVTPPDTLAGTFVDGALPLLAIAAVSGATLHFTTTTSDLDPEAELVVLAFSAADLDLLIPASGLPEATVPLDGAVLLVQDFIFGDGVDQSFALVLDLP